LMITTTCRRIGVFDHDSEPAFRCDFGWRAGSYGKILVFRRVMRGHQGQRTDHKDSPSDGVSAAKTFMLCGPLASSPPLTVRLREAPAALGAGAFLLSITEGS
jgi:hypothetical protein